MVYKAPICHIKTPPPFVNLSVHEPGISSDHVDTHFYIHRSQRSAKLSL